MFATVEARMGGKVYSSSCIDMSTDDGGRRRKGDSGSDVVGEGNRGSNVDQTAKD
jgi:hypothetical protein